MTRMQAENQAFDMNRKAPKGVDYYAAKSKDKTNDWVISSHDTRNNRNK